MKRPNAILHMILWGIGSGVLLGASYAVIFALLISLGSMGSGFDALVFGEFVALTGFGVFFGALYGAPLGLVLGILTGFALREKLNRGFELPLTDESLLALRKSMDITIAAVAFFGTAAYPVPTESASATPDATMYFASIVRTIIVPQNRV